MNLNTIILFVRICQARVFKIDWPSQGAADWLLAAIPAVFKGGLRSSIASLPGFATCLSVNAADLWRRL